MLLKVSKVVAIGIFISHLVNGYAGLSSSQNCSYVFILFLIDKKKYIDKGIGKSNLLRGFTPQYKNRFPMHF
jgi:hypothetical protein